MILSFPGRIKPNSTVDQAVGQIDLFSTIMDYLGSSDLDSSDGSSLRRYIDETSTNDEFDERIVVAELDNRLTLSSGELSGSLGDQPNFLIVKGWYKLMLPKNAQSSSLDLMYDLESDPHELNNLLRHGEKKISKRVIGKAEHLKVLLMEWMLRNDGDDEQYYSDPVYNLREGRGDIKEVSLRRSWRKLPYWQSDFRLEFTKPVEKNGEFVQNEYLYIGRTQKGKLRIQSIYVKGRDKHLFTVSETKATIAKGEYIRVKVTYRNSERVPFSSLKAKIVIENDVNKVSLVDISRDSE
jgi:hypothetical protein